MTPTTGSPKPTNEEFDIEVLTESSDDLYPWAQNDDEKRRCFIFEYFNFNADIHIDAQLQQLKSIERWLIGNSKAD